MHQPRTGSYSCVHQQHGVQQGLAHSGPGRCLITCMTMYLLYADKCCWIQCGRAVPSSIWGIVSEQYRDCSCAISTAPTTTSHILGPDPTIACSHTCAPAVLAQTHRAPIMPPPRCRQQAASTTLLLAGEPLLLLHSRVTASSGYPPHACCQTAHLASILWCVIQASCSGMQLCSPMSCREYVG
jgi:hypothetical protein